MGQYHEVWAFAPGQHAETIDHYALGAGAKLGEQAYTWQPEGLPAALASPYSAAFGLIALTRWAKRKLVVIGDYAEDDDVPGFAERHPLSAYYGAAPYDPPGATRREYEGRTLDGCADVTGLALGMLAEAAGITQENPEKAGWGSMVWPADLLARVERWLDMDAIAFDEGEGCVLASSNGEFIRPEAFGSPRHPLAMPFLGGAWGAVLVLLACSDGRGGGDFRMEPPGRWAYTKVKPVRALDVDGLGLTDVTKLVLDNERIASWLIGGE